MTTRSSFRAVGRLTRIGDGKIAIAAIIAIGLLALQTGPGQSLLRAAGLSRPTAPFVELYFPDARSLPSSLPASRRLTVHFALGNRSTVARPFVWTVSEEIGSRRLALAAGRSVVPANRAVTVTQPVRVACPGKRTQLLVSLQRSSARLTLWLACRS